MTSPSWDAALFAGRRARVLDALGEGAAMVVAAAPEVVVGRDVEVRYVADADFWYLTGYEAPDAVAVLCPSAEHPFTLFVRDRDAERELWTGPREEPEAARERIGADAVVPVDRLAETLPKLLAGVGRVHFQLGTGRKEVERVVLDVMGRGRAARQRSGRGPGELADPGLILDDMRLIKDPEEIRAIRDAVDITVAAFREALDAVRPGGGEWEVEAAIEGAFRSAGAEGPAFPTIAASGPNATVLHYTANSRVMGDGDLLLLDAGARHRRYNADLTRTVAVNGALQGAAADVHAAVRAANRAAIDAVRPGATIRDVHDAALRSLLVAMVDLGLLHGDPDQLIHREQAWKRWFPHTTSHWLGLDVHDVGTYAVEGDPRPLVPGMVLTIEPGLYVPAHDDDAPDTLRGIGVRIEDDVLVTDQGPEVLSAGLD